MYNNVEGHEIWAGADDVKGYEIKDADLTVSVATAPKQRKEVQIVVTIRRAKPFEKCTTIAVVVTVESKASDKLTVKHSKVIILKVDP